MHSEKVHIETSQGDKCGEDIEKEGQKYTHNSTTFKEDKVPIEFGDICCGEVRLGRVEN